MGLQAVLPAAVVVVMAVAVMNSIRAVNNAHTTVQLVHGDQTMASIWQAAQNFVEAAPTDKPPDAANYLEDNNRTRNNNIDDDGANSNSDSNKNSTPSNLSSVQQLEDDQQQQQQQQQDEQVSDVVPPYMQHMTHILVVLHCSVFITGLIGNALVCLSVYRNKSLQTVTNYYIVNLAVADFLVILICLPPTVYWDLTLTWNFGLILCKLVPYLQSTSVSVSVLTLTCISLDRWYAICRPLEFCSTKYRAKVTIALIWLISMLFTSPDLIYLTTKPLYVENDFTYMDCTYSWPETQTKMYQLFIVILLFIGPFVLMSISYWHIINVLWRNETVTETLQQSIQFEDEQQFYKRSQMTSSDSAAYFKTQLAQQPGQQVNCSQLPVSCNNAPPISSPGDLISITGGTSGDSATRKQNCSSMNGDEEHQNQNQASTRKLISGFVASGAAAAAAAGDQASLASTRSDLESTWAELQAANSSRPTRRSEELAPVVMTSPRPTPNETAEPLRPLDGLSDGLDGAPKRLEPQLGRRDGPSRAACSASGQPRDAAANAPRQTSPERPQALSVCGPPSLSSSSSGQSGSSSSSSSSSAGDLPATDCGRRLTAPRYRRISVVSGKEPQRCASEAERPRKQAARPTQLLAFASNASATNEAADEIPFARSTSSSSCASLAVENRFPRIRQLAMNSLNNGPDLVEAPKMVEIARAGGGGGGGGEVAVVAAAAAAAAAVSKEAKERHSKGRSGEPMLDCDSGNCVPVESRSSLISAAYAPMCESESARRPSLGPKFVEEPIAAPQGAANRAGRGHSGGAQSERTAAAAAAARRQASVELAAQCGAVAKVDNEPFITTATPSDHRRRAGGFQSSKPIIKGKPDNSSLPIQVATRESELSGSSSSRFQAHLARPLMGSGEPIRPPSRQKEEEGLRTDGGAISKADADANSNSNGNTNDKGCFRRCFEATSLVGPLKRKGGQSVGTYKTTKKYRQNLANYAAQRDKYQQKRNTVTLRASMGGVALITTTTTSTSATTMAPTAAVATTPKITENLAAAPNRAGHAKSLPAKRHLKPATVQQIRQKRQQQHRATSYSVGPRSASLMAGEQLNPTADGSLQANQGQQQQSTNNIQQQATYWSHTRFCKLIESRKKAAKMLIVIVIMFGLCYLPVHFLNILRYTVGLPQNDITLIASLVSHWLCYFNSAVNPLIYNLMSGKFRHEFANLFFCKCFRKNLRRIMR